MRRIDLKDRTIDQSKLEEYGFKVKNGFLFLEKPLSSFPFTAQYTLKDKVLECHLIDNDFQEEYELVDLNGVSGYASFVKEEYEAIIRAILSSCTIKRKNQKDRIIEYIVNHYQDELEHLWPKFPADAIIRKKENRKWYCLFMELEAKKLGLEGKEVYDVRNLKGNENRIASIDNTHFFPGYHRNKKHWYTILLDDRRNDKDIIALVKESYSLAS